MLSKGSQNYYSVIIMLFPKCLRDENSKITPYIMIKTCDTNEISLIFKLLLCLDLSSAYFGDQPTSRGVSWDAFEAFIEDTCQLIFLTVCSNVSIKMLF